MNDDDDDFEFPEDPPIGFERVAAKLCDAMEPYADELGEGTREMIANLRASLRKLEELDVEAHALKAKIARLDGLPPAPQN